MTSFRHLLAVDVGFTAASVTTGTVFPPPSRYPDSRAVVALSDRILDAVRAVPGVESAGMTSNVALSGRTSPAAVTPADSDAAPDEELVLPSVVGVSPGYFETIGTPLVRGRHFAASDRAGAMPVAIVDQRLAERFWPSEDPIGKGLYRGDSERYTVVGVVRDVRFESPAARGESIGAVYFPHAQAPPLGRLRWIAIRTAAESPGTVNAVREALADVDPDLPLADVQTLAERRSSALTSQSLAMRLASVFGVVALFLSMLGTYSVLAYAVARRRRELGIRMALGSTARAVFRLVLTEGGALIAAGLVIGLVAAAALGRVLEGQVFGVRPTDPVILGSVSLAAGGIALLACIGPARRAARVDPVEGLQH